MIKGGHLEKRGDRDLEKSAILDTVYVVLSGLCTLSWTQHEHVLMQKNTENMNPLNFIRSLERELKWQRGELKTFQPQEIFFLKAVDKG